MTTVTHEGNNPPVLPDFFDPNSIRWVWWSYPTSRVIVESSYILPAPLSMVSSQTAVAIQDDDGVTRNNSNGCEIDFNNAAPNKYLITNRVRFSDGEEDDFSTYVIVRDK